MTENTASVGAAADVACLRLLAKHEPQHIGYTHLPLESQQGVHAYLQICVHICICMYMYIYIYMYLFVYVCMDLSPV